MKLILIVDASESNLHYYGLALKNHSVIKARTPQEALEFLSAYALKSQVFDVLIVYEQFPGTVNDAGYDLAEKARNMVKLIIITTTAGDTETQTKNVVKANAVGADLCLREPIRAHALQRAVEMEPAVVKRQHFDHMAGTLVA